MAKGFMEILPYILGGAAGLAGPRVGPALNQGVQAWRNSRKDRQQQQDRERNIERQKVSDARESERFADWQSDQEYEGGRRKQIQTDRQRARDRDAITQQRADTKWDLFLQDRPIALAAAEETRQMRRDANRRANQSHETRQGMFDYEMQQEGQASQAFADLAATPEGAEWLAIPGVKQWVQGVGSSAKALEGFRSYQEDKSKGGNSWQWWSRMKTLSGDQRSIEKDMADLEEQMAEIQANYSQSDVTGLSQDQIADIDDSQFKMNNSDQAKYDALTKQWSDLAKQLQDHKTFAEVSGYTRSYRPSNNPIEGLPGQGVGSGIPTTEEGKALERITGGSQTESLDSLYSEYNL